MLIQIYEAQTQYSFSVIATDAAGNASQAQSVTLDINNIDEIAPIFNSSNTASILESLEGNNIVYQAIVDDSFDVSAGVEFSLSNDSDTGLSIDANSGQVILDSAPNFETKSSYQFTVIASDNVSQTEQLVNLSVINQDLDAPVFVSLNAASVNENIGSNQVIYAAVSQDESVVSYSLNDDLGGALSIDQDTGEVRLSSDPDYEANTEYSFTVVATDTSGNFSEQVVTVSINDLDDANPTITSTAIADDKNGVSEGQLDENSGAGQVIYTATADDSGDDIVDGPIAFSLADGSDSALSIDAATGEVTLSTDPDYEAQAQYNFSVIATDAAGNASEAQSVTLDINNLDETAPVISSPVIVDSIDENTAAGQVIYTAQAVDTGDVTDGSVSFSLAEGSDVDLSINQDTGEVTLSGAPDFEAKSQYNFTVVATDSAGNIDSRELTLNINNLDEANPQFISSNTGTIINGTSSGSVIYRAIADDSADTSAGVTYSFAFSDDALSINTETGEVTINEDVDSTIQSTYEFGVLADDRDDVDDPVFNTEYSGKITLTVDNQDIVAPIFDSSTPAVIDENIGANQVIYTAIVDDQSLVTFSLTEDSDEGLEIDPATGEVTLSVNPDHEDKTDYNFTVVATDEGDNEVQQSVTVSVTDLDDANPTITSLATATIIDENSGAGQVIYTATADDSGDDIADTPITFSLAEGSDAGLIINANTGEVILLDNPDHESKAEYSFTVIATDAAGNASAGQLVTLNINNLDDTAPEFTSSDSDIGIAENSGADQVIYTATAQDVDDETDGSVSFSLSPGSDDGLSIDAISGEVSLTANPDYEAQTQYSFTVIVTDSAGNNEEQSITLNINNLDEQAPTFISLSNASVLESTASGSVVYRAVVDDSADISGGVTYSLAEGSDSALSINSGTGEVTINETLDYIAQPSYNFTVVATDAAGNPAEREVLLSVIDQDLEPPVFTSDESGIIDENTGAGQVIYTAVTADESIVSYSLTDDSDGDLTIDSSTGKVILTVNPDHEAKSQYNFTVKATDTMNNFSELAVIIDINDLDDAAPTITSGDTASAINENSVAGQVIYTAAADDFGDDIADAPITFSLDEGSDSALSIDSASGAVTLNVEPDFEIQAQYSFAVIATDAAGNASAPQSVTLDINNLDDTAPIITSSDTVDDITEYTASDQVIYTVIADDSADVTDGVTYGLVAGSDAALSIDSATGEVTLTTVPDYVGQSAYDFTVIATDTAGNESLSKALTLNIIETAPLVPEISLAVDTGLSTGDNISQDGLVNVSNIKLGASWEYSLDNGENWVQGAGSSFNIALDGVYQVKVRQTNASETFTTSMDTAVEVQVDAIAPQIQQILGDSEVNQVVLTFDGPLNETLTPSIDEFEVSRSGIDVEIDSVSVVGSTIVLHVLDLEAGPLQVNYTPSESSTLIQDLAGNELAEGFTQMIVSDGYIRGAEVYEVINDGITQSEVLIEGVTTDEFGQLILGPQYNNSNIIVKNGINMDSGATNELELTAPAGYKVINPLSTLVQEIVANASNEENLSTEQLIQNAEQDVGIALGINLDDGVDLSSYDPLSGDSLDDQKVVIQIATVLAVASAADSDDSGTDNTESTALSNLADIVTNSTDKIDLNASTVEQILSDGNAGSLVNNLVVLTNVVNEMSGAENLEEVTEKQAILIDEIRPNTPMPEPLTQTQVSLMKII